MGGNTNQAIFAQSYSSLNSFGSLVLVSLVLLSFQQCSMQPWAILYTSVAIYFNFLQKFYTYLLFVHQFCAIFGGFVQFS